VSTLDGRDVRRARVAVSALFLVNGAILANVLPRLPALKAQLELSNTALGTAIAAMPVGGLLAGSVAGLLIVRYSSRRVTVVGGVLLSVLLALIGLAPGWLALAGSFLVLGMVDAVMDSAMNAHGIAVQRSYGRSIMHGFHGWWSAGTLLGAAMGALAAAAGIPLLVHLVAVGIVLAGVSLAAAPLLLRGREADTHAATPLRGATADGRAAADGGGGAAVDAGAQAGALAAGRRGLRLLARLAPFALIGILGVMLEDAAQTWSTIYLTEVLGAAVGIAAIAVVLYTAGMTVGRLTNDRWIDRWGDAMVGRAGAILASLGLVLVIAAGSLASVPLAALGFGLVGLGASPLFPVMITAAGTVPGVPPGQGVALVTWLGRGGFVIAPALVGVAADAVGLAAALIIPLIAGLSVAVLMGGLLASSGRGVLPGDAAARLG
jgi:fucose permease